MSKKIYFLFSFFLSFILFAQQPTHGKKSVGYYAQWAIYGRDYNIPKIDGSKLTHLNYAFFGLTYDPAQPELTSIRSLDKYADFEHTEGGIPYNATPTQGNFYDLKQLKIKYPHLKIMISIGGWTKGQEFPAIAANPAARVGFANNLAAFLVQYPFIDGFDLDWEFPLKGGIDAVSTINGALVAEQPHTPDDNKNLVYLLKEIRRAMPTGVITIAAGNNVRNVGDQYIGPNNKAKFGLTDDITTYCDFITYFGYDLGGNWYDKTCHNAPLYPSGNPDDPLNHVSDGLLPQQESVSELTDQFLTTVGIPASKLVMGLPFYGKLFNHVANKGKIADKPGLFVAAPRDIVAGCANPQPPAGTWDPLNFICEFSGAIEICDLAGNVGTNGHHYLDPVTMNLTPAAIAAGWVRYWDSTARVPYLYNEKSAQFIMYDDKQSIDEKVKYTSSKGLGGVMIWELSQDVRENPANGLLAQTDKSLKIAVPGTVSITGTVKSGTTLVTGTTVELRDVTNNVVQTAVATDGNFTINNVVLGSAYTLTAVKPTYKFTPVPVATVTQNINGVIVQGTQPMFAISGTVLNGTTPVTGVAVTATSGTTSMTGVSSATGAYTITGLLSGLDYTVTANKPNFSYLPLSIVIPNLTANVTQNFTQSAVLINPNIISGTVKNGATPVVGAVVEMSLEWEDNTHPYLGGLKATTDANGVYSFPNSISAGYKVMTLVMNSWQNKGVNYFPTTFVKIPVPTVLTTYNFNSSSVTPQVSITNPIAGTISGTPGGKINFSADASLTFADATTTIQSVIFTVNGTSLTGTKSTGNSYTASWTPLLGEYNKDYSLGVKVTASNSVTATDTRSFFLQCTGANCPNTLPVVNWVAPATTTINQASSFAAIPVSVDVTDADGTIASVSLSIDGSPFPMTKGTGNVYTYSFTPTGYKTYSFIVTATDNSGGKTTLNRNIDIVKSSFTVIPPRVILGYAHGWENTGAPFLFFRDIANTKFNMVAYAFIETTNRDGYTPNLVINEPRYLTGGVFNPQLLKDDIAFLKSKGIPVIVSIGGQNGHVVIETTAQKNIFVNGIKAIIDTYGFDGVDLDFEGGSMNFAAGGLRDFSYAGISEYPKLKNVVDAFKELKAFYGKGFIITAAPEVYYVQVGLSIYGDAVGSFLPVIENLRNELDLLMVQLYNTGSVNALDGIAYSQANPDFLTSMSEMLVTGFNVGSTGYHFDGLPASKILLGIPACRPAAPAGGYLTPDQGIQAFDYFTKGTDFAGRKYTLRGGPYPNLRGVMTWSINWDGGCATGYEFSNAYSKYFSSLNPLSVNDIKLNKTSVLAYFKQNTLVVTSSLTNVATVEVFNTLGQSLAKYEGKGDSNESIFLNSQSFNTKQLFIVNVTDNLGNKTSTKVLNFLN